MSEGEPVSSTMWYGDPCITINLREMTMMRESGPLATNTWSHTWTYDLLLCVPHPNDGKSH